MKYEEDFQRILAMRHGNGSDFWATPEGKIGIEKPFSTLSALLIMGELRVPHDHEAIQGAAHLVFNACRKDGRVQIAPKGSIYPCQTAVAAAALCRNGFSGHPKVKKMLAYLLSNRYKDGGWRCNKFIYGHGPETEHSNPGVTLMALDAFHFVGKHEASLDLGEAVETLLDHWTVRIPIGPCHYGIGKQFMQVEYPFLRYNLFYYVYVLSFYSKACQDKRFLEAFRSLCRKLDKENRVIVERPPRKLADLQFCKKGQPSEAATERYQEILRNIGS